MIRGDTRETSRAGTFSLVIFRESRNPDPNGAQLSGCVLSGWSWGAELFWRLIAAIGRTLRKPTNQARPSIRTCPGFSCSPLSRTTGLLRTCTPLIPSSTDLQDFSEPK